jgi:hypothetical protein
MYISDPYYEPPKPIDNSPGLKCPNCQSRSITTKESYIDEYKNKKYKRTSYQCDNCNCLFEKSTCIGHV